MVRMYYVLDKIKYVIEVPFKEAKYVNKRLFAQGAAVYWSEVF